VQPFVVNRRGRLVFPSNFVPDLDFSVIQDLDQLAAVIRRDFETKAPTGTEILQRVEVGAYGNRFELLRDVALNLFWANRFAMTMYEKRPTRWRDVPRGRDDVFLPVFVPWVDGDRKVAAVEAAYGSLPAAWGRKRRRQDLPGPLRRLPAPQHHATEMPAVKPTVAEILADPGNRTWRLASPRAECLRAEPEPDGLPCVLDG